MATADPGKREDDQGVSEAHADGQPGQSAQERAMADEPRELPFAGDGQKPYEVALTVPPEYVPRKRPDVLELDMGDGLILYNHEADLVHHLNPSAAVVWQICDGEATVAQLGRDTAEEFGLQVAGVQRDIAGLVAELEALGLVEDADGPEEP